MADDLAGGGTAAWPPTPLDLELFKFNLARLKEEEPERFQEIVRELRHLRRHVASDLVDLHLDLYWEAAALTAHQVDTPERAWESAGNLFHVIEERHGPALAREIFSWFGGATKHDRKALFDQRLRAYHEYLCSRLGRPVPKRKFAEHLAKRSAKVGWYYGFGRPGDTTTADAIRDRLYQVLGRDE